jgi:hypothetical protein
MNRGANIVLKTWQGQFRCPATAPDSFMRLENQDGKTGSGENASSG